MNIQKYCSSQIGSVINIWELATEVGHPFLSKEFLHSEKKNIPDVYIPNGNVWVVIIDNNVVGFSILHGNEVGALFVLPEFHGRGVGYALMNKAHEMHNKLKVEVFKENAVGTKFYARYGFNLVREYFHKESEMVMLCLEHTKDS